MIGLLRPRHGLPTKVLKRSRTTHEFSGIQVLVSDFREVFARATRLCLTTSRRSPRPSPAQWQALRKRNVDEVLERQYCSTQVMTSAYVPFLTQAAAPRLLFIPSGRLTLTGSENPGFAFNKLFENGRLKVSCSVAAYPSSKCGMNMMMREGYHILGNDGVKVW